MIYLQLYFIFALVVFAIGILSKAAKWSRMPPHLRWELYPVPREPTHSYGGSFMEELEWWKKPRKSVPSNEMKEMTGEMLFIKRIWKQKRSFWYMSYSFHAGIYSVLIWGALLLIGVIVRTSNFVLSWLADIAGWAGIVLMTLGSISLLITRLSKPEMRNYATKADVVDLVFSAFVAVSGLAVWAGEPAFGSAKSFVASLFTFQSLNLSIPVTFDIALIGVFVMYVPFTRMSHFVGKYFTYHKVMWDDLNSESKKPGEKVLERLKEPVTWSAPHLTQGKDWLENVREVKP